MKIPIVITMMKTIMKEMKTMMIKTRMMRMMMMVKPLTKKKRMRKKVCLMRMMMTRIWKMNFNYKDKKVVMIYSKKKMI